MAHTYPPEDPRSAASTFAPHQPGAGVVADDVEAKGQNEAGGTPASEATEQYKDKPHPNADAQPASAKSDDSSKSSSKSGDGSKSTSSKP